MLAFTADQIRSSFVNASRKEASDANLPEDFADVRWDRLDFLGWADPKSPRRAYMTFDVDGEPVSIALRQADASPRVRAQCNLCLDVELSNDVAFFSAKLAGAAGRKGDTIGTLVCSNFACSRVVRKLPVSAYPGYDREAERARRVARLQGRSRSFLDSVLAGAAK